MTQLNLVLLFVDSPLRSASFYQELLGHTPVETSPTFALFVLPNGIQLGLWSRHTAEPLVSQQPGATEVSFETDAVDELYTQWSQKAIVLQKPTDMDFGRTFVVQDPDGHRLRAYKRSTHV